MYSFHVADNVPVRVNAALGAYFVRLTVQGTRCICESCKIVDGYVVKACKIYKKVNGNLNLPSLINLILCQMHTQYFGKLFLRQIVICAQILDSAEQNNTPF